LMRGAAGSGRSPSVMFERCGHDREHGAF
jgi:hypothetical protein